MNEPDLDITEYLKPGDTVVIGEAVAEPPILVEKLIEAARTVDDLTALCGYTLSKAWVGIPAGRPHVTTYAAHGALRRLGPTQLDVLPVYLSRMDDLIATGRLPVDVVLLQVGPADEDGYHDLGLTVDYVLTATESARVVLAEVNEAMPRTRSVHRLHRSRITATVPSTRPLAGSPARPATDVELRVAANVASLIPDGAVVQLGASALAEAIARQLWSRRGLRVRSGLVGDWLVGLHAAGAIDPRPGSIVTGIALGGPELYAFLDGSDAVDFAPINEQTGPTATAEFSPFYSVNSAVEVDLAGQLNSELAGGRYVGAVGGQVDFFRATQRSADGRAIVALASTGPSGESRILPRFEHGMVTTLKSDVDLVVTEWGIADIGACSLRERRARLAEVAHPDHRDALAAAPTGWV